MTLVEIKRAHLEDLGEILQLQKEAYMSEAEIYNDYSIAPLLETTDEIIKEYSKQVFLKAIRDNELVGSVRAYGDKGTVFIGRLIVRPNYQNQGIGTMLMRSIEKYFEDAKRFELFTGQKSNRNLHLYQKLGYRGFTRQHVTDYLTMIYLEKYVD